MLLQTALFSLVVVVQGFLQQVEGEVKLLRGELKKRDDTIRSLSSSLATLTSRLGEVEKSSSLESERVGKRERVCVCVYIEVRRRFLLGAEFLEKQQSELSSELSHTKSSLSIMMVSHFRTIPPTYTQGLVS